MENVSHGKFYILSKNKSCLFFLVQINNWKKSRPRNLCLNKYVLETMPNTIYKKKSKANTRADWFKTVFLFNSIDLFIRASLPPQGAPGDSKNTESSSKYHLPQLITLMSCNVTSENLLVQQENFPLLIDFLTLITSLFTTVM